MFYISEKYNYLAPILKKYLYFKKIFSYIKRNGTFSKNYLHFRREFSELEKNIFKIANTFSKMYFQNCSHKNFFFKTAFSKNIFSKLLSKGTLLKLLPQRIHFQDCFFKEYNFNTDFSKSMFSKLLPQNF